MVIMQAMLYIYFHFIATRAGELDLTREQMYDMIHTEAKVLERKWDGVGEWRA